MERSKIQIDLFASVNHAQETLFLTEHNSSWNYNWHRLCPGEEVLWANPPFEDVKKVLTKACLEPCRLVVVIPVWKSGGWQQLLDKIMVGQYIVPHYTPLFERAVGPGLLPGKHWTVSVNYIDTFEHKVVQDDLDPLLVREIEAETQGWGMSEHLQEM